MHNKVKLEQHFSVKSSKMVAIFQAILKLVREEARTKLSNKENLTDQNIEKRGTVNKKDTLI